MKANPACCAVVLGLIACGCATHRSIELDAQHPAVRVTTREVLFADRPVSPHEVAAILEDHDVPHDRVIHILLDPDVKDLRPARFLMATLAKAGYTRPVLVTKRHAESRNLGKVRRSVLRQAPAPRKSIRYRKANE